MSLLSDTQGRPERVWSLLRLLQALGGRVPRSDVNTWMMPASFRDSEESLSQVTQTIGSARSLGLVEDDGDVRVVEGGQQPGAIEEALPRSVVDKCHHGDLAVGDGVVAAEHPRRLVAV